MPCMRKAFTLIELLVVIAIIAILAAILFPVFTQAKMAAKQSASLSNEKQLGIGTMLYLANNDDQMFFYGSNAVPSKSRTGAIVASADINKQRWWNVLMPYLKSNDILKAPADELPTKSPDANGVANILRSYIACRHAEAISQTSVESVAETIMITEKWGATPGGAPITDSWIEPFNGDFEVDPATGRMLVAGNRYQKGLISTFFDGHAKILQPGQINSSVDLTGCRLVHALPVFPDMCDTSISGCTNNAPENVCNKFSY